MIAYLITNLINGRKYVGITSQPLLKRWCEHKNEAIKRPKKILHRAMASYGVEFFRIEIISRGKSFDALKFLERDLIGSYGCKKPNGYNMTDGGDGKVGFSVSNETKLKLSIAHTGKVLSADHRRKMSLAKVGKPPAARTPEWCRRISVARMGHGFSKESLAKMSAAKKGKPWSSARRAAQK